MISVAIDGPAGAGKSTIAKLLSHRIGATYIDTGAMYRAITYKALVHNIELTDEEKLADLISKSKIELITKQDKQLVLLDGMDISEKIRDPKISQNVSIVASHAKVRGLMVELQRELAKETSVVMDGRDIGTTVLPTADFKFYLTASIEERAKRRYNELLQKGFNPSFTDLLIEIENRDRIDSEREVSPLKKAGDAIELDTTSLTIDEVVQKIYELIYSPSEK